MGFMVSDRTQNQVFSPPVSHPQHLVLLGGGHSHAIVLKHWAKNPLPDVNVTLISNVTQTPYSGMLPGYVAGLYPFEDTHIDLPKLCKIAQVEFCLDEGIRLDLEQKTVICRQNPAIHFDVLSIDIGSTPQRDSTLGALEYAIPAKPVPQFLQAWQKLLIEIQNQPQFQRKIAIVGGGAGGVELALAMQGYFSRLEGQFTRPEIHLFHRHPQLINTQNSYLSQIIPGVLKQAQIYLHLGEEVCKITSNLIHCKSQLMLPVTDVFWVTQASAPEWIKTSGLATDEKGFMAVSNTLQSLSHPFVFGAGDVATLITNPRPKAGVFAVRQGKPLFKNLQRSLQQQPLQFYHPQKNFLGLIGTGDKKAIATWGNWGWGPTSWLWKWKDIIDRQFMEQFHF